MGMIGSIFPGLAEQDAEKKMAAKRALAMQLLDHALSKSTSTFDSGELNGMLNTGQFPPGVTLAGGGKVVQPKTNNWILNKDTGKLEYHPELGDSPTIHDFNPPAPQKPDKPTSAGIKDEAAKKRIKSMLTNGRYVPPDGSDPIEIKTKGDAINAILRMKGDAEDPMFADVLNKYQDAPETPDIWDRIKSGANSVVNSLLPGTSAPPAAPAMAPAAAPAAKFATEADALKANLKPGSIVMIGGRRARIK